ncbi:RES domain-containing protein [Mycobacteroides abscessus]|uniref:RES domain-containing protein n=1 Tax=Mycobacteroides abscessus TaxID=36809 RepID=UPI002101F296|nr:RES domain-containing protein [Mycobacteroides abscessus]
MSEEYTAALIETPAGALLCSDRVGQRVFRVGYRPSPWHWTPWVYADHGRFDGRWDDPDGIWRTLYVGSSLLACYLELLARFRPDPVLVDEFAVIDDADEVTDDGAAVTVPAGLLPRSWCTNRLVSAADMSGRFAMVGSHESLPTLRQQFWRHARRVGLPDFDAAAIRLGEPRELTQAISSWIYGLVAPDGEPLSGIEFHSRHGDGLLLWAIYERDHASTVAAELGGFAVDEDVLPGDAELAEAMRIHRLRWLEA